MTINENGQSYLELDGITTRGVQTARSDYNRNNEYSEYHKDALGDGDGRGKGTGNYGGHGHSLPDMRKSKHDFYYGNFETSRGGDVCDVAARKTMLGRSLYNEQNQYGIDIVRDTSINRANGRFDIDAPSNGIVYVCPFLN
jgi:hypothetical protein